MQNKTYYEVACEDLRYLVAVAGLDFYNQNTVQCQQVVEKLLKSVAELSCAEISGILNSHNLRAIYMEVKKAGVDIELDKHKLSTLKDYYFDARYPGDNYVDVSRDEFLESFDTVKDVFKAVNDFRTSKNLYTADIKVEIQTSNSALDYLNKVNV